MNAIDTTQIPFPKTLAELAALDASREIPYLKALCNRRRIRTPSANPGPNEIIPIVQTLLADHQKHVPFGSNPHNGESCEWHAVHDDLTDFLTQLQNLLNETSQTGCATPLETNSQYSTQADRTTRSSSPSCSNPQSPNAAHSDADRGHQAPTTAPSSPSPQSQNSNPEPEIPSASFPKSLAELAALDANNKVPFLEAECHRLAIPLSDPNPAPGEILRAAEQRLASLRAIPLIDFPGGDKAWREVSFALLRFIHQLRSLIATASESEDQGLPESISKPGTQTGTHSGTRGGTESGTSAGTEDPHSELPSTHSETSSETEVCETDPERSETAALLDRAAACLKQHAASKKTKAKKTTPKPRPHAAPSTDSTASPAPEAAQTADPHSDIGLSALCQEISDELNRKTTSPLDNLDPELQQTLFKLLNEHPYTLVQKVVAMPAPRGWGMKISRGSLQRFYDRYEKRQTAQQLREAGQIASEILSNPDATDADLLAASTRLANIRLLNLANNPTSSIRDLKDLFQIQIRLKSLALAQQRLELQKQKDTAKQKASSDSNPSRSADSSRKDAAPTLPADPAVIAPPCPRPGDIRTLPENSFQFVPPQPPQHSNEHPSIAPNS